MIDVERRERVVHLVINAPPVNVLDSAILGELTRRLAELADDTSVAAVVLSGQGRCFSAGASVTEHREEHAEGMLTALADACLALPAFPAPVVAAVHGACLGGAMELISFCDFVVAASDAKLGQPEIKLSFLPPVACHQLPRLTGMQNAAFAILSGESLSAERAMAMGLVQKILPREQWHELDALFNGLSAPVLRVTKQALAQQVLEGCAERLDAFKELFLAKLYPLEDVAEGIRSFEERRPPEWKHR
jgi:cyclohexa-1,5-dienecarbonyl-CoA hydratase